MKKRPVLSLSIVVMFLAVILLGSCVSKKKFLDSEQARVLCLERERDLKEHINKLDRNIMDINGRLQAALQQVNSLKNDTARMGGKIRTQEVWLSSNMSERDNLNLALSDKIRALEERESTIRELQSLINSLQSEVDNLLNTVKAALTGFNNDELTVTMKNGKVYVAMSDKLLFSSGSADVDKRGKEALAILAGVLVKQPEIDVVIEGHTDSIPIKTTRFKDNWDLSVIRATSVVRILTVDYGVSPLQIQASGRSEYYPVDTNATTEGKARNRRTEIILSPKLDKLLDLLQKNPL